MKAVSSTMPQSSGSMNPVHCVWTKPPRPSPSCCCCFGLQIDCHFVLIERKTICKPTMKSKKGCDRKKKKFRKHMMPVAAEKARSRAKKRSWKNRSRRLMQSGVSWLQRSQCLVIGIASSSRKIDNCSLLPAPPNAHNQEHTKHQHLRRLGV